MSLMTSNPFSFPGHGWCGEQLGQPADLFSFEAQAYSVPKSGLSQVKEVPGANLSDQVNSGEDAFFIAKKANTGMIRCLGIADGVSGWSSRGGNSGEVSKAFMSRLMKLSLNKGHLSSIYPKDLIIQAYYDMKRKCRTSFGSCTTCVVSLNVEQGDPIIYSSNLGDSGFLILRRILSPKGTSIQENHSTSFSTTNTTASSLNSELSSSWQIPISVSNTSEQEETTVAEETLVMGGSTSEGDSRGLDKYHSYSPQGLSSFNIIYRSKAQKHSLNCPYQLAFVSHECDISEDSYLADQPAMAENIQLKSQEGDIILMATDGLFDNLFDHEIVHIISECLQNKHHDISSTDLYECSRRLCREAARRVFDESSKTPFSKQQSHLIAHSSLPSTQLSKGSETAQSSNASGGVMDDVTVICARVVRSKITERKNSCEKMLQNHYLKQKNLFSPHFCGL